MIGLENARQNIRSLGWLALMPMDFRTAVVARAKAVQIESGRTFYASGDDPRGLYGLGSGGARVIIVTPNVEPAIGHFMLPGVWFGQAAFVDKQRTLGIVPTRDSLFFFLNAGDIDAIIESDRQHWRGFATLAVINSDVTTGMAFDLMDRDPVRRCAHTLLRLAGYRHSVGIERDTPEIDITQGELAQMSNLSRNKTAAILQQFRSFGFVKWSYKRITVICAQGLRRYAIDRAAARQDSDDEK